MARGRNGDEKASADVVLTARELPNRVVRAE